MVDGYELIAEIGFGPLSLSILSNLEKVCDYIATNATYNSAYVSGDDTGVVESAGSKANKWTSTAIEVSCDMPSGAVPAPRSRINLRGDA